MQLSQNSGIAISSEEGFAPQILAAHSAVVSRTVVAKVELGRIVRAAFECGRLLNAQQAQLGRKGNFDDWCHQRIPEIPRRTVYHYKAIADQIGRYLELVEKQSANVALSALNFPTIRQLYIALGILPATSKEDDEPKPEKSFLDPLLRVLANSKFEALKDDATLNRLSRDELFLLDRSLEPFLSVHERIQARLSALR